MYLYDQHSRLIETVASRETAGEYFQDFMGVLPDPDPILLKMGEGPRILADLEADDQVTAITMARKNRVLNRQDYWFKPGALNNQTPTEVAKMICDRLVKDLENLTMREVLSGFLQAPFYGYSVSEISWEPSDGWWHIKGVELKPHHWFGFNRENKLVFKGVHYIDAQPIPEGKFILARHFPTYENPYGLRLLSRCFWPVTFKKGGLTFYTRFLEKYGSPWAVGIASSQATEAEMDRMALRLSRMVREATAVLPAGAKFELVSPPAGTTQQHEAYLTRMDAAISKVLMGNTLTSEIGDKGSYAAAETHKEVADEFAESDMDLVVTAFNELAWIYTMINVGPGVMAPQFYYEEPEDLNEKAELDRKLYALGVRFKAEHFVKQYSLPEDAFTVAENTYVPGGEFEFASARPAGDGFHQAIERAVEKYVPEAARARGRFVSQIEKMAHSAASFEELERGLAELMGAELDQDDFVELLGDLMVDANLMGRFAEGEKRREQ